VVPPRQQHLGPGASVGSRHANAIASLAQVQSLAAKAYAPRRLPLSQAIHSRLRSGWVAQACG